MEPPGPARPGLGAHVGRGQTARPTALQSVEKVPGRNWKAVTEQGLGQPIAVPIPWGRSPGHTESPLYTARVGGLPHICTHEVCDIFNLVYLKMQAGSH